MKTSFLSLLIFLVACTPASEKEENYTTMSKSENELIMEKNNELSNEQINDQKPMIENCNLILGFDAWEPYQYVDVGDKVAGLDIELVQGVAKGIGCEITYQQGTWVNLLAALKQGEIDILLGASKTDAREEFAYFSDPYRMEQFSLYVRKDDEKHHNFGSLTEFIDNGSRIGLVSDYVYGDEVASLLDDPEKAKFFVNAIMGEMNIARLLDDDIDGFLEDSYVGASMLRRKALSEYIVAQGITVNTGNAYVMFSQQSIDEDQLALFNKELQRVKKSKSYADLLTKYSY